MKRDSGRSGFGMLKELPPLCKAIYNGVAARNGLRTARRTVAMAVREPEYLAELTRGLVNSPDYDRQALTATGLLMAMSVRGPADAFNYKSLSQISTGFNRLYLPLATQRPDLSLALTAAAFAEPNMPEFARDQVAVGFAGAGFALLRSSPQTSIPLLQSLARHAAEPDSRYISAMAREAVVRHLTKVADAYPVHFAGQEPRQGVGGGALSIPAETALALVEAIGQISRDGDVKARMDKRAGEIRQRAARLAMT